MKSRRLYSFIPILAIFVSPVVAQQASWEATTKIGEKVQIRGLYVSYQGSLLVGTDEGLFRSTDDGGSWLHVGPTGVNDLDEHPSGVLVAVGREGVHRSTDDGVAWLQVRPKPDLDECGDVLQYTHVLLSDEKIFYAGSIEETTTSGGCKIEPRLYLSADGSTWTNFPAQVFDSQAALPLSPDKLILGLDGGGIYRYLSEGTEMTTEFVADFRASVTDLVIDQQGRIFASTGQDVQNEGRGTGIYRSIDVGSTWSRINTGLSDTTVTDLAILSDGTLLAATLNGGVNRSIDGGDSWHPINNGLTSLTVRALASASDGRVFAGTDQGLFRTTQPLATANEKLERPPASFWLGQNYPNPFATQTTIPFDLAEPIHVSIIVYNVLGRELTRLADRVFPPGAHLVEIDARGLPEGLYLYRLRAGSTLMTGKMTVIR